MNDSFQGLNAFWMPFRSWITMHHFELLFSLLFMHLFLSGFLFLYCVFFQSKWNETWYLNFSWSLLLMLDIDEVIALLQQSCNLQHMTQKDYFEVGIWLQFNQRKFVAKYNIVKHRSGTKPNWSWLAALKTRTKYLQFNIFYVSLAQHKMIRLTSWRIKK